MYKYKNNRNKQQRDKRDYGNSDFNMTFDDYVKRYLKPDYSKMGHEQKMKKMLEDVSNVLKSKRKCINDYHISKSEKKHRVSKKFKRRMKRLKKIKPHLPIFEEEDKDQANEYLD